MPYLLRDELQALLDAPDPATREGTRDRAMLHLAVCAGLRAALCAWLAVRGSVPTPEVFVSAPGASR